MNHGVMQAGMPGTETIHIGMITISRYTENVRGWEGKIWINNFDGEGMQCDTAELEKVIAKFYEDNF